VGRAPAPAAVEEVKPVQRAANDDRQSVGQVLQSMQRRPSRAPYMAAFFLSAVWVLLGIVVGASYFGTDLRAIASQGVHPPVLARAAELEALVHNEVAALERAYNDNELRIRGLIEDLANQRDSLVGQAEQVRNAITGVHLGLTQDIASVSEMVAASVNDAAQR